MKTATMIRKNMKAMAMGLCIAFSALAAGEATAQTTAYQPATVPWPSSMGQKLASP